MVIYRGPDGKPGYHQTDDIHDAVGFVEQLRNDQGVEHARIFRLEEVGFEYRPYFRVELTGAPSLDAGTQTAAVTAGSGDSSSAKSDEAAKVVDTMVETSSFDSSSSDSKTTAAAKDTSSKVAAAADDVAAKVEADAPTITSSGTGDNGVGARRGLFGR